MNTQKLRLATATIKKFKSIESNQSFEIEDGVTILVGMNESGKTSVLEALAKTNYFQDDSEFKFNSTHDYPRREKKSMEKSGADPVAIECKYVLSDEFLRELKEEFGEKSVNIKEFSIAYNYSGGKIISGVRIDKGEFLNHKLGDFKPDSKTLHQKLMGVYNRSTFDEVKKSYSAEEYISKIDELGEYFSEVTDEWKDNPLGQYLYQNHLALAVPKFLYYDEYYSLPSRIAIEELRDQQLVGSEYKTARALFELADINIEELLGSDDFEDYKAELEATEATISDELFKYWSSNQNLEIEFAIDKKIKSDHSGNQRIARHILDIRVKNKRARVSLPLRNRSKGFNWFFSFLVWFKKVQEDKDNTYVLLLDEPGLNLHASAQADLLRFIEDLSVNYQIIYTTHSPFMVEPRCLHRIRTVYESEQGTVISDSLQEKDPKTLFPLQAALGYDIAQNLFIGKNNLLVEGVSDMLYLQVMSELVAKKRGSGLRDDITIVPVGGLEKVVTFISLLRGSKLSIVCLMDSIGSQKVRAGIEKMIVGRIIQQNRILYYDQFVADSSLADVEDIFSAEEYLEIFNHAFAGELPQVTASVLTSDDPRIVKRITTELSRDRFNHFRPASFLCKNQGFLSKIHDDTIERFAAIIDKVNGLF